MDNLDRAAETLNAVNEAREILAQLSTRLRQEVLAAYDVDGHSYGEIARRFGVAKTYAVKLVTEGREGKVVQRVKQRA